MNRYLRRFQGVAISCFVVLLVTTAFGQEDSQQNDPIRDLQQQAMEARSAEWGHWGTNPERYSAWTSHSNRMIPVYTFGMSLESVTGENSVYRDAEKLSEIYRREPENTLNAEAEYLDQTDIYHLQQQAVAAGKKYIILMVFDGMDWPTTQAAAVYKSGKVGYQEGRGAGLQFQDYRGVATDFGYMVTSPYSDGGDVDVNTQMVQSADGQFGGYDPTRAGAAPWVTPADAEYLLGRPRDSAHAYTDSSSSAASMTTGIKTYNASVNVGPFGRQVETIAHQLARTGRSIGVVTSVPISHATPAAAYSHNVSRNDYQDLSNDLLGLPSVSHPQPLGGVDVLIGAGWGIESRRDNGQGENYVPGNKYLSAENLAKIDVTNGGRYRVAQRSAGQAGGAILSAAAQEAAINGERLFGFFGAMKGHLPFQTADGGFNPPRGAAQAEEYSEADIAENPTLAQMTEAALSVLERDEDGFWLMVESGDVDWANHDNNIDNSIGAVLSGDAAFSSITKWAEQNGRWEETALIVTADHGHFLVLNQPEVLLPQER